MHNFETLELFRENKFFTDIHTRLNEAKDDDEAAKFISKPGSKKTKGSAKFSKSKKDEEKPKKSVKPEDKEAAQMEKEAMSIVKKARDNFGAFKKSVGDDIKKVIKFWEAQSEVVQRLNSKYPVIEAAYAPVDSNFIYAVQNVAGTKHLIVIKKKTEGAEENPYIDIVTENGVSEFAIFLADMKKELLEYKQNWKNTVEKKKKEEAQAVRKQKLEKVLKEEATPQKKT